MENGETTTSACLYCDKMLKECIEKYLEFANKKMNSFRQPRGHFKGKRGGGSKRGGKRRGGGGGAKNLNW